MYLDKNWAALAPLSGATAGSRTAIQLKGTGTAETSNDMPLPVQKLCTILNGAVPIRVTFRDIGGLSGAVTAGADFVIPANTSFTFLVEHDSSSQIGSRYVYAEAADGVAAYEAFLWISGR